MSKRTLKFRAWDKNLSEMCHVDEWNPTNILVRSMRPNAKPRRLADSHAELMQFTGLLSKSGQEIYEGDVVRLKSGTIAEIRYGKYASFSPFIGDIELVTGIEEGCEVIGNVHEHPELLKV